MALACSAVCTPGGGTRSTQTAGKVLPWAPCTVSAFAGCKGSCRRLKERFCSTTCPRPSASSSAVHNHQDQQHSADSRQTCMFSLEHRHGECCLNRRNRNNPLRP